MAEMPGTGTTLDRSQSFGRPFARTLVPGEGSGREDALRRREDGRIRHGFCRRAFLPALCVCAASGLWAGSQASSQAKQPVAVVGGEAIYEEDLLPLIEQQMQQLKRQEYEAKSRALDSLLSKKLLEIEAKKEGVDAATLLEREVAARVSDPSDAEIEAFYMAQKDRINQPLEAVREQVRQALKQAREEQARQTYFESLRGPAQISIYLRPPRTEVSHDPARVRGDADAPVTIVEFSDFQCPFCQQAYGVVKGLLAKYPGKVKLAYRDFPLRQIHPQAQTAAEASRCAGEQGKFWEYHDVLFDGKNKFDRTVLEKHAATLGLDPKQFGECLDSGKFRAMIEQDLQDGARAGVEGTPAFFINGVFLGGAQPAAVFEKAIEGELAASPGTHRDP